MKSPFYNNDFARRVYDHDVLGGSPGLRPLRIGVLDIESTDLDPVMGELLCTCIKEVSPTNLKGKIHTARVDDKRNPILLDEKWVVEKTIELMNSFDLLVHWYGSRFDIPYINTKALMYGFPPPIKKFRRDLCYIARGSLKLPNYKLATVGRVFFKESGKSFLDPIIWKRARKGDKKAIAYIVDHCEKDVIETEKIYRLFMPIMGKLKR